MHITRHYIYLCDLYVARRENWNTVNTTRSMAASAPEFAACLTGPARSFSEIGVNVREGTLRMLRASPALFGVRPESDPWTLLRSLMPFEAVSIQKICWSMTQLNSTIDWLHCDMRARPGADCRVSFLQTLCDLAECNRLIRAKEVQRKRSFYGVLRLRPDLFWESMVELPRPLRPRTIYVPAADSQGGVNDHLAVGLRQPMELYLTRIRHLRGTDEGVHWPIKVRTTEMFLRYSLGRDRIAVRRLPDWMYCAHTRSRLYMKAGFRGCIGRVRCRSPCASLVCDTDGLHAGDCRCFNATCDAITASAPLYGIPSQAVDPNDRYRWLAALR